MYPIAYTLFILYRPTRRLVVVNVVLSYQYLIVSASEWYGPFYHQEEDVLRNMYRDMKAVNPGLMRSPLLEEMAQSKRIPCRIHHHYQHSKMDKVLRRLITGASQGAIIAGGSDGLQG